MVESQTATEFINELTSTGAFECKKCRNILESPVYLSENLGNICSSCYNCFDESYKEENKPFIPNTVLDDLLKKMVFECPFVEFGCNEKVTGKEMQNHKSVCKYRTMNCIFSPSCIWEGRKEDCAKHLASRHGDKIILRNEQNKFTHSFTVSSSMGDTTRILKTNSDLFVMKMNISDNTLRLVFLDINNASSKYKFSLKFVGESKSLQTSCLVKEYISNFDLLENEVTALDLNILKSAISSQIITLAIKIKEKEHNAVMEASMLHHFECPVCKNFMKPPIFQCNSGHSVCNFCKPKLERCPTCRGTLTSTRNYSLEALTSQIKYPCTYHDHGCEQIISANYIASHESSCIFRPYPCCFRNCGFNGSYSAIKSHFFHEHADKVCYGDTHNYTMAFYLDKFVSMRRYVIVYDDRVFKLTYHQSQEYTHCGVDAYFSDNPAKDITYIYEVGLVDKRQPDKKIIRTDICLRNVGDEELFRKCCSFPNNIVMSFSSNNTINFYVKISKKI